MRALIFIGLVLVGLPAQAFQLSVPLARAIEQKNWHIALAEAKSSHAMRSYITWRQLLDDEIEASPAILMAFIDTHTDWPRLNRLQSRTEKLLFQNNDRSARAKQYLTRHAPISGYGKFAIARLGDTSQIKEAWIEGDFERQDETIMLSEFGSQLDRTAHVARAERLLLEGRVTASERMLSYVGDGHANLYRARIGLIQHKRNINTAIDRVPSSLKNDHGLLADRTRWRHKRGLASGTRELLLAMRNDSPYADKLWRIRASYIRDAIEAQQYEDAAKLLKTAGSNLTGGSLADARWLSGWLDLTFRNQPKAAYESFFQLYHNVSYPISRARGAYWAARAAQANGNMDIAQGWYKLAAQYPTAFYGQLAQSKLNTNAPLSLPAHQMADRDALTRYETHSLTQAAIALHDAQLENLAVPLMQHLAKNTDSPGELAALMKLATRHKMIFAQVRIAKEALKHNIMLRDGWPTVQLSQNVPIENALAHAIMRQESEFNARAVSSANARGIMQLLPSTAKKTARKLDKSYALSSLFDPTYNAALGSKYLGDLIDGFDGSYILAIAGYNAGPSRSRQWTERFGRPGYDLEDTLTWIELIPFSETRNYVQRVLEHTQIYRSLKEEAKPLDIEKDLLR